MFVEILCISTLCISISNTISIINMNRKIRQMHALLSKNGNYTIYTSR